MGKGLMLELEGAAIGERGRRERAETHLVKVSEGDGEVQGDGKGEG